MRATSDGGWSDEDGLNPTTAGHSQIDDITVTHLDGTDIENFEGAGPYEWNPEKAPFAGFFGKFFSRVTDLDPCRDAESPVMGFVDDGTPPSNPSYTGTGTGGTTSDNWSYGVPGGWVTNYNGGLSLGALSSRNEFWSPPIQFDLPGPADDGIDFAGLFYKVSVYEHLPLTSGNFWQWHVRGSTDGGVNWSPWANRSFVYFSGTPRWVAISCRLGRRTCSSVCCGGTTRRSSPSRARTQRLRRSWTTSVFRSIGSRARPSRAETSICSTMALPRVAPPVSRVR
jgi:hypothetical protein